MALRVQTSPRFAAGEPEELFKVRTVRAGTVRDDDVSPDSSRFLVAALATKERDLPSPTVIANWQAGLQSAGRR